MPVGIRQTLSRVSDHLKQAQTAYNEVCYRAHEYVTNPTSDAVAKQLRSDIETQKRVLIRNLESALEMARGIRV